MKLTLVLACAVLAAVPAQAAEWVRVETPHLIVFGPGEKKTREVVAEFERFREAIGQVLPGAAIASAVPTTVVVFENENAFAPYRPKYNGKPVRVSGFYTGTQSDNLITFPYSDRENALRTIFHEYTHLITANTSRALPAWVAEGVAEFYSTFQINQNGKEALLGATIPSHYVRLGENPLLPLEQILTVDHGSSLYNEGERRSIFYAQSWAMVHMFMVGEPNRSKEFSRYVNLSAQGMPPLDAWKQAFGDFDVLKELRKYLSRFTTRAYLYKFPESVAPAKPTVATPGPGDVAAVVARLLRYGNDNEVEPRLRKAVEMTPRSSLARALLGEMLIDADRDEEGTKLLVDASADTGDWLTQYYVATGIADRAHGSSTPDDTLAPIARKAVDVVLAARPGLAQGLALKARLTRGQEGLAAIVKARTLAPGREDYVYLEAQLRADLRDFGAARTTLAPLLGPNYPREVREAARSLMGQIVRMEEFHTRRATPDPPRWAGAEPSPSITPPSNVRWVFREVQPGETRVEGTLEAIDCARNGAATLSVRVGDGVQRFSTPSLTDIDFLVYRQDAGGSISCGPRRPPDRVYLTWRPLEKAPAGIIGRPVAVEFLPEKQ